MKTIFSIADSFSSILALVALACYASDYFQECAVMAGGTILIQFVIILIHREQLGFTYKENDSEEEF